MSDSLPVARKFAVNNHDVASLLRRWDRALVELTKSSSANVSQTLPFDVNRLQQSLKMLESFTAWVVSQPPLDAPESNPVLIDVPLFGTVPAIENDSVWDLAQLVDTAIIELANSQSARLSANLFPYDEQRQAAIVTRVKGLVAHIAAAEPVDYPESSPRSPNSGEGITGINYSRTAS